MTRRLVALQLRVQPAIERRLERAMDRDRGATAVEYGLMVALIAGVIIAAVTLIGTNLRTVFETVAAKLTIATAP
jgi:pilus assembly protein Flp/PilA